LGGGGRNGRMLNKKPNFYLKFSSKKTEVFIFLFSIILPLHPNTIFLKVEDKHIKVNKKGGLLFYSRYK
jgi:hypothetical protein